MFATSLDDAGLPIMPGPEIPERERVAPRLHVMAHEVID
jgi:hypothetical protein